MLCFIKTMSKSSEINRNRTTFNKISAMPAIEFKNKYIITVKFEWNSFKSESKQKTKLLSRLFSWDQSILIDKKKKKNCSQVCSHGMQTIHY